MNSPDSRENLPRYNPRERTNHWITAIAFVLAALSGLALFHPALFWLSNLFGGGPWTRLLHPYIALVMVIAFALLAAAVWKHNRLTAADREWLRRIREVASNRDQGLPEVGRYNAGQKLVFYLAVICLTLLLLTGIVMWRAYFSQYFPIGLIRAASVIHAISAFVLICAIIVHIYAAFWVKGSVRAMTRGTVTPGWAWKHHRAWFRELIHAKDSRSQPD